MKKSEKNIWFLGFSSFFNDIGSEMITPLLPFLITGFGGGGIAIGALSGIREGLSSIFKLLGGWYSDKLGKRKPFVFLGYFLSTIFRFFLAFANSWQYVLGFTSLERVGKSRDAPRDAIISQSTKQRGRGFGIQQMLDTSGAILGSIIVLLLLWKIGLGFKTIILIAGGISIFSLAPLFFVKEPKTKKQKKSIFKGVSSLNNKLKYFIFVMGIFTLVNFGLYMFLLLRVRDITGSMITAIALGLLFNFIWAIFSIPFGTLSDRIGRKKVLMAGYVLFFLVTLGFVYLVNLTSLIFLFVLYGLVWAIVQTIPRAYISDLADSMKGTAFGFYQFVIGIVSLIGGIIAGVLWNISPTTMFTYMAVGGLISIVFLLFVKDGF